MGPVHALVPEILGDLVDALQPAYDEPFQIQLVRDAKIEVHVEGVVPGHEGAGGRSAVERLQHRRLDLEELARVEERAQRADDRRPLPEHEAHLVVHDQVGVALPVADLHVRQAVPFLGERPERFRQELDALGADRDLPRLRHEHGSLHADPIPQVQIHGAGEGLRSERVLAEVHLLRSQAVLDVREGGLAVSALGHEAPRVANALPRLLQLLVTLLDVAEAVGGVEAVRVGLDSALNQRVEFLAARILDGHDSPDAGRSRRTSGPLGKGVRRSSGRF